MRAINDTTSMVKRFCYLCCLILAQSCGHAAEEPAQVQGNPPPAPAGSASAVITIIRDGKTIASYESHRSNMVLHADMLMIEMNSPDNRFSFMGYIGGSRSGKYDLDTHQQRGKATITIFQDTQDLPASITPTEGQFSLTGMNGKSCSGSFSGSLKDNQGRQYKVKGHFRNIPVRNIEAGK